MIMNYICHGILLALPKCNAMRIRERHDAESLSKKALIGDASIY